MDDTQSGETAVREVDQDQAARGRSWTRAQHLQWSKERALAELDGDRMFGPVHALASIASDLGKHPETAGHQGIELGGLLALGGHLQTPAQVRKHIEGFR